MPYFKAFMRDGFHTSTKIVRAVNEKEAIKAAQLFSYSRVEDIQECDESGKRIEAKYCPHCGKKID